MLKNIEQTFNSIWHTRTNRKSLANFLLYWAILSRELLSLAPFLLEAATFTLIFIAVPNSRAPVKHVAIGGLVTAMAFEIATYCFTLTVKHTSEPLIYGAFAAVPLFLLWIYVTWLIILAGAELVHGLDS